MGLILLALFIAVPILEIAVFIQMGGIIGLAWTLALIVLTALAGTALLRQQGLAPLRRAQETMARNEMPIRELFDGACLLVAGLLLLTPGFITDGVGALLLIPPVRETLRRAMAKRAARGTIHMHAQMHGFPHAAPEQEPRRPARPDVIDGEYEEVREPAEPVEPAKDSKWGRR